VGGSSGKWWEVVIWGMFYEKCVGCKCVVLFSFLGFESSCIVKCGVCSELFACVSFASCSGSFLFWVLSCSGSCHVLGLVICAV